MGFEGASSSLIDSQVLNSCECCNLKNGLLYTSKLNPMVSCGTRKKEDEFQFNKDAGIFVCPAEHMAIRKDRQGKKDQGKNQVNTCYFGGNKFKYRSLRDGC
ncbi:hypothetical protein JK636_03275 [Clostridium sp. YIM B02515]|uniref:Uncharacterized protein n=1 Tax=Clostridium rhizosphaerae TaxID=2803861 RepID=A0ABS1T7M9_9CLOT|nr:hypothetical protein [Clostridium rhizosphaerae]MBL4934777.1 hypothetical protein [Clostridium rhizosphaerae]